MLNWLFPPDLTPTLTGRGLLLRSAHRRDFEEWRRVRLESRPFLKPFEPRWTEADLSHRVFRQRLRRMRRETLEGTEYSFLIFAGDPGARRLVGGLTLSNIRRRAAQYAYLGYWMGVKDAGKGIMSDAVALVLPFAFQQLDLNRVQAACLPHNQPSRRVLEKNGFKEEGYAERYLQIDGEWQDHVLYALTRDRFNALRTTGEAPSGRDGRAL